MIVEQIIDQHSLRVEILPASKKLSIQSVQRGHTECHGTEYQLEYYTVIVRRFHDKEDA